MTIDVINVDGRVIKSAVLKAFEKLNDVKVSPNLGLLSIEPVCDKNVMLQDPNTKSGVVLHKVKLRDFFPKTISVRAFKNVTTNAQALTPEEVNGFNEKYGVELVNAEKDVLKGMSQAPVETVRNFILFCRVFGFYELDIGDVSIYEHNGVMTISVNDTNKFFTGYIEVLV